MRVRPPPIWVSVVVLKTATSVVLELPLVALMMTWVPSGLNTGVFKEPLNWTLAVGAPVWVSMTVAVAVLVPPCSVRMMTWLLSELTIAVVPTEEPLRVRVEPIWVPVVVLMTAA